MAVTMRPHTKLTNCTSSQHAKSILRCGDLAGKWQQIDRGVKSLITSFHAVRGASCWRQQRSLVAACDALRTIQHMSVSCKSILTQTIGVAGAIISRVHKYNAHTMVNKPHYFFASAYDPHFLCKPVPSPIRSLLKGNMDAHEVKYIRGIISTAVDLIKATHSITGTAASKDHASAVRSLQSALASLERWQKHEAARVVQQHWRECIANPGFLVCRKRLRWEFETM
jgi:hypothetical protein